ncbi:MAG: hypothetical protein A2X25_03110 [Chloroflexi bacterium GWB2_49_20]|nr:MAG: hypothetical protein A2X25_03110 [Chloroflexi bacterium GWB2_49_20]OGN76088.1 MAG: hypothetical protein A2X26_11385 [Chloroflexi bacterium GWC2_49_37]OGN83474.1 MAG: hypothetical protein A2X27_09220 [Chloroflexi bacterium GWD2_49_16]HBG73873.1 hypothetical protein [Anaerolineae bacterium]HCC79548.1 hypothetical protein [Anaerolineae bacterium]
MNTKPLESTESSSPIITRAVAASLQGKYCDNLLIPSWQKQLLLGLGWFPQGVARQVISHFQTISGLSPKVLEDFSIVTLVNQRLNDYAKLDKRFSCITLGAGLGGATTYISKALGGPFLPQTFVLTLKGGAPTGDVNQYFNRSHKSALKIAEKNPEVITIQHFDPIHDGWLTRYVNHLRFKLLSLPSGYSDFIRDKLVPGGTLVYLDGQAEWLRYKVGPHSFFQVGGWGDISAQEFLDGSPRIQDYAMKSGLSHTNWKLDGFPSEHGAESEWGSEPGMADALEEFCATEGYRFVHICLPHPNDFSRLAFNTAIHLLEKSHQQPAGVLVEMFTQFDSQAAFQSGLLPLWLIFNTHDSLVYLEEMLSRFPPSKPVFFSPLATFSITPDIVPWSDWEKTLSGWDWINIGTRPSHYPSDSRAIVRWADPLRAWVANHPQPLLERIDPIKLFELSQKL